MGTIFSETLKKMRKEWGFPTAYRFYHDNGGAPALKVSYRKYLLMEEGRNLPVFDRLMKILHALRVPLLTPPANELVTAWLKTMAGEEAYGELLAPLLNTGAAAPGLSPMHKAVGRSLSEQKYHMTLEQFRATMTSYDMYRCAFTLESDTGTWTAPALAKILKIKQQTANKALKDMAKVKLAKEVKKGAYRSLLAGHAVVSPDTAGLEPDLRKRFGDYIGRLRREGIPEFACLNLVRADKVALRSLFPVIHASVEASQTCATTEKTKNSSGYLVLSQVIRLWDF